MFDWVRKDNRRTLVGVGIQRRCTICRFCWFLVFFFSSSIPWCVRWLWQHFALVSLHEVWMLPQQAVHILGFQLYFYCWLSTTATDCFMIIVKGTYISKLRFCVKPAFPWIIFGVREMAFLKLVTVCIFFCHAFVCSSFAVFCLLA